MRSVIGIFRAQERSALDGGIKKIFECSISPTNHAGICGLIEAKVRA